MAIQLGNLQFSRALKQPELLAEPVVEALQNFAHSSDIGVAEIDPELSDTAAFCEKYEVRPEQAANCVIIRAKRGGEELYAACVILANTRIDVNNTVRKTLEARKASFAPMETAVELTGMEYGAITPIGLPEGWPVLIDDRVGESDHVIIGSGIRRSKLVVRGSTLANLPNVQLIEGLAT